MMMSERSRGRPAADNVRGRISWPGAQFGVREGKEMSIQKLWWGVEEYIVTILFDLRETVFKKRQTAAADELAQRRPR